MANEKRVIMKHSLAKALMDAGMDHFDGGGVVGGGGAIGGLGSGLSGLAGDFTTQNTYNANAPDMNAVDRNQDALGSIFNAQINGGGPNPAQLMYTNNANQIAQTAATTNANNRALNPGLAARMSGNQAVQATGQAAGGAAALQAEQQLAAEQNQANLLKQQQNAALTAEGINSQVSQNNVNSVNKTEGGMLNGIGGAIGGLLAFAKGGQVPDHLMKMAKIYHPHKFSDGGEVVQAPNLSNDASVAASYASDKKSSGGGSGSGGSLPSIPSSDSFSLPELGSSEGLAASAPEAAALFGGGKIPGKPTVSGDSYKNDVVPALVSPGEEVIDRETMNDPGPIGKMARTVAQHIANKNGQSGSGGKAAEFMKSLASKGKSEKDDTQSGYSKVAEAKRAKKGKK